MRKCRRTPQEAWRKGGFAFRSPVTKKVTSRARSARGTLNCASFRTSRESRISAWARDLRRAHRKRFTLVHVFFACAGSPVLAPQTYAWGSICSIGRAGCRYVSRIGAMSLRSTASGSGALVIARPSAAADRPAARGFACRWRRRSRCRRRARSAERPVLHSPRRMVVVDEMDVCLRRDVDPRYHVVGEVALLDPPILHGDGAVEGVPMLTIAAPSSWARTRSGSTIVPQSIAMSSRGIVTWPSLPTETCATAAT